jgi:hypothetical protein
MAIPNWRYDPKLHSQRVLLWSRAWFWVALYGSDEQWWQQKQCYWMLILVFVEIVQARMADWQSNAWEYDSWKQTYPFGDKCSIVKTADVLECDPTTIELACHQEVSR